MANTKDTIISQVPGYILESYPRFFDFLEAYYDWLHQDGNPYERIKYHMDYLDFQKSLDAYVEQMKNEYLNDVPDSILLDKELFIKWSKKFNLTRGSHASYKFMFKLLFDEQTTEIYLPKENILKTSDGTWVSGESKIILTATGNIDDFKFQIVEQEREVTPGNFEYAYATVQSSRFRYSGKYRVIELSVTDIDGEFKRDYPVTSEAGASEYVIDTVKNLVIDTPGTNNQVGDRVVIQSIEDYYIQRTADTTGSFDCRVTTFFKKDELTLNVNSSPVTDFTFDGRTITSSSINSGDNVEVTMPASEGYFAISEVDPDGAILDLEITEAPIGIHKDYSVVTVGYGTGFTGTAVSGLSSKVNGYYKTNKGQLSSNMYLQDSFYYQEYSYAIKTSQDISTYSEIVKELLHPGGFKFFGNLNIIQVLELIIGLAEDSLNSIPSEMESRAKYTLGPNYSFFDRFKAGLSHRLYSLYHFIDKDDEYNESVNNERYMDGGIIDDTYAYIQQSSFAYKYLRYDMEMAVSEEKDYVIDDYVIDEETYVEEIKYNLEDSSLERTYASGGYYEPDVYEEGYFDTKGIYGVPVKGWMTKHYFSDYHLYIPQDYSAETESANNYFETGYVSERT